MVWNSVTSTFRAPSNLKEAVREEMTCNGDEQGELAIRSRICCAATSYKALPILCHAHALL